MDFADALIQTVIDVSFHVDVDTMSEGVSAVQWR